MGIKETKVGETQVTESPKPQTPKPKLIRLEPDEDGMFPGAWLGINTTTLEAYCGKLRWKIRPDGHTKNCTDCIREIYKNFQVQMRVFEDTTTTLGYEKEELYEKTTKGILEYALVGFKYNEAANEIDAGPANLGLLAEEVRSFLVELGGKAGSKHLQMLSKLVDQNGSSGLTP